MAACDVSIYTIGYTGWGIEAIRALLDRVNGLLVDVRLVPQSRFPGYRAASFRKTLESRYVWVGDFGNLNYKRGGPTRLRDFEAGADQLAKAVADTGAQAVVLMCGCSDVNVCHRKVVAARLAKRWRATVEHLPRPASLGTIPRV